MNEQLLKTSGAIVLFSRKKLRKTLWGVGTPLTLTPPPPPPLYVQGLTRLKRTPQPYLDRAFFAETRVRGWGGSSGEGPVTLNFCGFN